MTTPLEFSPKDALEYLHNAEWVWLDVREEDEWDYGHIEGIQHMPMSQMTPDTFASYSKQQKFMVICRTGGRSAQVVHALRQMGFENACNFGGGMMGYNMVAEKHIPVLV